MLCKSFKSNTAPLILNVIRLIAIALVILSTNAFRCQFNDSIKHVKEFSANDISCVDAKQCYLVGSNPATILKTSDGFNWMDVTNNIPSNEVITCITCFDSLTCVVSGDYYKANYKTIDGGSTWFKLSDETILTPIFLNEQIGFSRSQDDSIVKTTDGGINWYPIESQIEDVWTCRPFFLTESYGLALVQSNSDSIKIYKTSNGGANWKEVYNHGHQNLNEIKIVDSLIAYAVGAYGIILKSTDAGETWNRISNPFDGMENIFYAKVDFLDKCTGYVIALQDYILKTDDEGETWTIEEKDFNLATLKVGFSMADKNNVYLLAQTLTSLGFIDRNANLGCINNEPFPYGIFPNPGDNMLYINLPIQVQELNIKLINSLGQIVLNKYILSENTMLNIESLANGMYLIQCFNKANELILTEKYIIK